MNDRNTSESSQNRCEIEENRNLDTITSTGNEKISCGLNGFTESELSSSHEQHAGKSHNDSIEKDRTDKNGEFIMGSELGVKDKAEGKQIGTDIEENSDYERLKELLNEKELNSDMKDGASSFCANLVDSNGAIVEVQEPNKVPCEKDGSTERLQIGPEKPARSSTNTVLDNCAMDVPFMGKLVRTQIITHVGSLVFQGDDSKVLLVIDQPITELLEHAGAPPGLTEFARTQYGGEMTLMDLEPSIVISAIDAVRYRSVTADLVQKAVLSLTRAITHKLQPYTVNVTMLFYKGLFADENMKSIVTEKEFVQKFKICFSNATERLNTSHNLEEIRAKLSSPSFVV